MKKFKSALFLVIICFISSPGFSQHKQEKLRVFIIGNSFSQNAATYLPQLAKEKGFNLELGRAELGGCSLQRHWEIVEAHENDPADPMGKQYGGKSLKTLLKNGVWDVVTIQQYSLLSGDINTYKPYASKLYEYVKAIQPNAKIVVHQTWAYRSDAKNFGKIDGEKRAETDKEMWQKSRAAYHTIAKELNAKVIPTGDAFWNVVSDRKWAFKKDPTITSSSFIYPKVQNEALSLHVGSKWDKDKKLVVDYNHASEAGCYLGSLVWFGFLFDESPKKINFKPQEVSEKFAKKLKTAAKNSLSDEVYFIKN
ncbi:MAG TPA: DUF4886 domain-containing protein [Sphingobacteriaceae bacterium]|nr:DUF4886 domain-containing protein [Sphingobacteriaceae bacterium]